MSASAIGSAAGALQPALERLLRRVDPRLTTVAGLARVSAGATLETWSFDAVGSGQRVQLILRRAAGVRAAGTLSLPMEAQVLESAGRFGVPVPAVWCVLEPDDALGEGFLMARIDGLTIPPKILRATELADIRPHLPGLFGKILASIHAVPLTQLPTLPIIDAQAQLDNVEQQYRAQDVVRPVMELALRWLHHNMPSSCELTLVHGDYRHGNLIIGADGVRAVLDWEGAHLGDPAEDLAWMCLPPWRFGELDKPAGGLGTREELWAGYAAASTRSIDAARVAWWEVMGSLRWGVICAEMVAWVRSGRDRTVERAMIARRASESELDLLRLLAPR